jgi:hypothetical protein
MKELFDRGFGKSKEAMDVTSGGERIVFMPQELINKHNGSASSPVSNRTE